MTWQDLVAEAARQAVEAIGESADIDDVRKGYAVATGRPMPKRSTMRSMMCRARREGHDVPRLATRRTKRKAAPVIGGRVGGHKVTKLEVVAATVRKTLEIVGPEARVPDVVRVYAADTGRLCTEHSMRTMMSAARRAGLDCPWLRMGPAPTSTRAA